MASEGLDEVDAFLLGEGGLLVPVRVKRALLHLVPGILPAAACNAIADGRQNAGVQLPLESQQAVFEGAGTEAVSYLAPVVPQSCANACHHVVVHEEDYAATQHGTNACSKAAARSTAAVVDSNAPPAADARCSRAGCSNPPARISRTEALGQAPPGCNSQDARVYPDLSS